MRRQKKEITGFLMLAAALTLTACSEKKSAETESETLPEYVAESNFSGVLDVSGDWMQMRMPFTSDEGVGLYRAP